MPLSEVHRTATRKDLESSQSRMTNYSSDLSSFMPDDEFVELLWENGQLVVQCQSRATKSSFTSNASSQSGKAHDKDSNVKMGRFSSMNQVVDELSPTVPSVVGLNSQEDDNNNGPWMNYPIEYPLVQSDYCSEFLSEFSGVDLKSVATNAKGSSDVVATTSTERITGFGFARASQNIDNNASRGITGGSDPPSRIRKSQLFHLPQQCRSAIPNSKPKEAAEFLNHGSTSSHQGPSSAAAAAAGLLLNTGSQKQQDTANTKVAQTSNGSRGGAGLMNFSHFSRAASLFKANLQGSDRLRSNEKASTAGSSNPLESSLINSNSGFKSISGAIQGKPASTLLHDVAPRSSTKKTEDVASVQQAERHKNQGKVAIASSKPPDQSKGQSTGLSGRQEAEKAPEAAMASSVCSGNSVGAASNDSKYGAVKRKCREGEESEYQSDDVEDDSVDLKKSDSARCKIAKRSRAAEVHNLSERRRRDRINERMRALQELIPNCNKVDKASMLDEAIEYLKTLQLQVQIMSMGAGLCMPPMMIPPAMQHLRAAPMYSPMGLGMGMGMGMGYGMGMFDMNGSPTLQGIPGGPAGLQMFGIPGQGFPIPTPQLPQYTPYSTLPMRPNTMGVGVAGTTCPVSAAPPSVVETAPSLSSKDLPHLNMNAEAPPHQTKADDSPIPTSSIQALKEQSVVSQMSDHTLHVSGNSTTNSTRENESGDP